MARDYRIEEFDIHESLGTLMNILSGYREIELAKETLQLILEAQEALANLKKMPVEVQLKAMDVYQNLAQAFITEERIMREGRKARVKGFGSDPVESILEKAFSGTEKVIDRLSADGDSLKPMINRVGQLSGELGERISKLVDREEISKEDREKLKAIKDSLTRHADLRLGDVQNDRT